jgi:hypothetical protein
MTKKRKNAAHTAFKKVLFFAIILSLGLFVFLRITNQIGKIASSEPKESLQIGVFYPFQKKEAAIEPPSKNPVQPIKQPDRGLPACNHDNGKEIVNSGEEYNPNSTCSCTAWVVECKEKKCVQILKDSYYPEVLWIHGAAAKI